METISSFLNYFFIFSAVYIQIFFLFTFFEKKGGKFNNKRNLLETYPSITILVPCFNEEKTAGKTLDSLLNLDYPKNLLKIIAIDDGSSDRTWEIIKAYENTPGVKVIHKKNGGKFTALNEGLMHTDTEFFSCLDADSEVEPDVLKKIMPYFTEQKIMAVIPSAIIPNPKNIIEKAQVVEYNMSVFFKKVFSLIGGLYVTPGTLPVYRKKVVDLIGGFRHGHNGEDAEMAFRMQRNHMKIVQCHEARVYTIPPRTLRTLFKQRVRWITAYFALILEYRDLIFRKKYGNFGFFTLPASLIALGSFVYVFMGSVHNFIKSMTEIIIKSQTIGFSNSLLPQMDFFYISTSGFNIIIIISIVLIFVSIIIGNKLAMGKIGITFGVIYYFVIFTFISPFWMMKSVYNVALSKKASWR